MDESSFSHRRHLRPAFTLVEMLTTVAILIIVLGLMVSLARHVRAASADQLTKDILHQFDEAMAQYIQLTGQPPAVQMFIPDSTAAPSESVLQRAAVINNQEVVKALGDPSLNNKENGLLNNRFDDLSIAYYDHISVRDAWGSPIVFMAKMHPAVGMTAKVWFFFSAGPDRRYLTRDDNLYSYDQPVTSGE
jgi:type II secretory pathway pseudopilin PulG